MFMSKTRGQLCSARVERAGMQAIWESTTEVLKALYEAVALPSSWAGGGSEQQLVLQTARISWKQAGRRGEGSSR